MPAKHRRPRVVALIPAHNEADVIAVTLASLRDQTVPPDLVLVVADNCTDDTAEIAANNGAHVIETTGNTDLKAGALNQGLRVVMSQVDPDDYVLIMDADSRLVPEFIAYAVHDLRQEPRSGAVCGTFRGERRRGLIHLLQRNEYDRFARSIARRRDVAYVLSGVATIATAGTLSRVSAARDAGLLPGHASADVYDVTCATEDIELTYALRKLGYHPLAPAECVAYTDTMSTWTALARQRIRWQRGMLDALRLYRINRLTASYVTRLAGMYFGSLIAALYLALVVASIIERGDVAISLPWLAVVPLFIFERVWTVRRSGVKAMLLAASLVPEWCYDMWRAGVYWLAAFRWVRRTERVWIPT